MNDDADTTKTTDPTQLPRPRPKLASDFNKRLDESIKEVEKQVESLQTAETLAEAVKRQEREERMVAAKVREAWLLRLRFQRKGDLTSIGQHDVFAEQMAMKALLSILPDNAD
jgi:hypothetical protein